MDQQPYLQLLHRALVLIRFACQGGDTQRAEAIADAVHNLPLHLGNAEQLRQFRDFYLQPLVERYPDLRELTELLPNG